MDIVKAVLAFLNIVGAALGFIKDERQKQTGIDLQRGRDASDALAVERKVADVAVQAVDVDDALKPGGEF